MFCQLGGYREWLLWQAGRSFPHVQLSQPVLRPTVGKGWAHHQLWLCLWDNVFKKQGEKNCCFFLVWNIWPPGFSLSPHLPPSLLSLSPWHLNISESFINLSKQCSCEAGKTCCPVSFYYTDGTKAMNVPSTAEQESEHSFPNFLITGSHWVFLFTLLLLLYQQLQVYCFKKLRFMILIIRFFP